MRKVLHRFKLTRMATASLLSLLSLLTTLGWRSKRGSPLHQMRLWVLAALVALAGGVAVSGCGDENPSPNNSNTGTEQPMPMCYEPPVMPSCYAPVERVDPQPTPPNTDGGAQPPPPPMPSCYQPTPMCYAPMEPEQPPGDAGSGGPQPSGEVQRNDADVRTPTRPPPPRRMCYAPRRRDPDQII